MRIFQKKIIYFLSCCAFFCFFQIINASIEVSNTQEIKKNLSIMQAIKKAFKTDEIERSQPLLGGFSSPGVYKIFIKGVPYVLRLSHPNRKRIDQQRSITCMTLSSERGLSPKIYYANPEDGIIITDFIRSSPSLDIEISQETLNKLALKIRELHDGPHFPEFLSVFEVRRKFEQSIKNINPHMINIISKELKKIETILSKDMIKRPTHNDLKSENILFDGRIFWFIDWEAASEGDPFFDLTTIIIFYNLNAQQENLFLKSYFGRAPTQSQKLRVYLMKQVVMAYYGTAYLMVSKIHHIKPLLKEEIEKLPMLETYMKNKISNKQNLHTYQELQVLGWILLKEVFKNLTSKEFKKICEKQCSAETFKK